MDGQIIPFPRRFFTACRGCGINFSPYKPWHRLCSDCYDWNRALNGIMAARQAFRELR